MLLVREPLRGLHAALHHLRGAEPVHLQVETVGIHLGELEQVVGEPRETLGMLENDLQETNAVLRIVHRAGEQRFRKALNRRERRLEFVGHVGDEVAADSFELAQIGDVVQHDDRAGVFRGFYGGNRCREKTPAQRSGNDFRFHARRALQNVAYGLDKFGLPHNLDKGTAGLRWRIQFENARETFVGKEQALGGINYSDALNHAAKNRGGEVALLRQRANRAIEDRKSTRLNSSHGYISYAVFCLKKNN